MQSTLFDQFAGAPLATPPKWKKGGRGPVGDFGSAKRIRASRKRWNKGKGRALTSIQQATEYIGETVRVFITGRWETGEVVEVETRRVQGNRGHWSNKSGVLVWVPTFKCHFWITRTTHVRIIERALAA